MIIRYKPIARHFSKCILSVVCIVPPLALQVFPATFVMQILYVTSHHNITRNTWTGMGTKDWAGLKGAVFHQGCSPRLPECVSGGKLKGPWKSHFLCMQQWWDCAQKCVSMHKFLGYLGWQINRRNLQRKAIQQVRWIFAPLTFQVTRLFRDLSGAGGRNLWCVWSSLPLTAELSPH